MLGYARSVAASSSSGSRSCCACARVRLPRRILAGAATTVPPTCSCSSAGLPTLRSQVLVRLISSITRLHHLSHGACFKIHMLGGTAWSRPIGFSQQHLPQSPPHVPLRATSHPSPPANDTCARGTALPWPVEERLEPRSHRTCLVKTEVEFTWKSHGTDERCARRTRSNGAKAGQRRRVSTVES